MTRLPSLDTLRVFAVAARYLSFTKAAEELHLTQSAVSHRVKKLETELGMALFERAPRHIELTSGGVILAGKVDQAVNDIARALVELDQTDDARRLTIAMLPSVASRWLMPRLSRFRESYPDLDVQVISDSRLHDLRAEGIDLAIRFGHGRYPGYLTVPLMPDFVFPVCSPRLISKSGSVSTIDALLELPILVDSGTEGDGSASGWTSWLNFLGRADAMRHTGQRFSEANLMIEAAVMGLGVGLARASLVSDHMANGILMCPLPLAMPTAFSYYLLALPETARLPKIVNFRAWLEREAAEMPTTIDAYHMSLS
jgi:LysR family glycine cleavage system transcriptional activator